MVIAEPSTAISVIGLGKLGLPMASLFARQGYNVIGIDTDELKIKAINKGMPPIPEPDLVFPENLRATDNYSEALNTAISFIVVNTPPRPNGELSLHDLKRSCSELAFYLKNKTHIVVISSTVPPGTLDKVVRPIFSPGVALVSNPHFIALGKVIRDLTVPNFVLIGSHSSAGAEVANIWQQVCGWEVRIVSTTPIMAEMIKFALTPYLALRIDYANMLCELCEHVPGTNVDAILKAVGLDRRLNTKELSAGLPYGGECYPKDIAAFIEFSERLGVKPRLLMAIEDANDAWGLSLYDIIKHRLGISTFANKTVAFLGISYKPGYPLISESKPLALAETINYDGGEVRVYDPYITRLSPRLKSCNYLEECLQDADIVIVAVGYEEFMNLRLSHLPTWETPVVDIWRVLKNTEIAKHGNWLPLGVSK